MMDWDVIEEAAREMADCMSPVDIRRQANTALEIGLMARHMIEYDKEKNESSIAILLQYYVMRKNREMIGKLADLLLLWNHCNKYNRQPEICTELIHSISFPLNYN